MGRSRLINRDRNGGLASLKKRMGALDGKAIKVGLLESSGLHEGGDGPQRATVAEVAAAQEFGTETIPSRPFLRTAFQGEGEDAIVRVITSEATRVVDGVSTPDRALGRIGLAGQKIVRARITELDDPPNAPATIEAKGSSNPLIARGQMRRAVNYEVVRKGSSRSEDA